MCGINGIVRLVPDAPPVDRDELLRTRDAMRTRGPDGEGAWVDDDGLIGLGHRRLAIIDLTDAGLQPMTFADGRYRVVFNGEIYNYNALRDELVAEGVRFRSHSDTEVIMALYAREGAAMLPRLRGMYALALWDGVERRLLLARDPYGIKPLYWTATGETLRFASQVKALEIGGAIDSRIDPAGLCGFLLWGSVPEPHTLRAAVRALPAGHYLEVHDGRVGEPRAHDDFSQPPYEPAIDVAAALADSVAAHLVSDVPVGVFLSAGLDSTLLAALACRRADERLSTFTLAFDAFAGTDYDEAPLAAETAARLGTEHIEWRVRRDDFLDLWPAAIAAMDQPSIDGFNTFVVSKAASDAGFKVVLSGLGGDELFGSYDSFRMVPRWQRWAARARLVPGLRGAWPALATAWRAGQPKLRGMLDFGSRIEGAYFLRRALHLPEELPALIGPGLARDGLAAYDPLVDAAKLLGTVTPRGRDGGWRAVHVMESTQYMRNQLLRDSDWASMAHSLELRVPLADAVLRRTVAAAGFRPAIDGGKAAVVRAAAPELPEALFSRPKSGFTIPVMEWLDDEISVDTARGLTSRLLARRVLDAFGVELEPAERQREAIA